MKHINQIINEEWESTLISGGTPDIRPDTKFIWICPDEELVSFLNEYSIKSWEEFGGDSQYDIKAVLKLKVGESWDDGTGNIYIRIKK